MCLKLTFQYDCLHTQLAFKTCAKDRRPFGEPRGGQCPKSRKAIYVEDDCPHCRARDEREIEHAVVAREMRLRLEERVRRKREKKARKMAKREAKRKVQARGRRAAWEVRGENVEGKRESDGWETEGRSSGMEMAVHVGSPPPYDPRGEGNDIHHPHHPLRSNPTRPRIDSHRKIVAQRARMASHSDLRGMSPPPRPRAPSPNPPAYEHSRSPSHLGVFVDGVKYIFHQLSGDDDDDHMSGLGLKFQSKAKKLAHPDMRAQTAAHPQKDHTKGVTRSNTNRGSNGNNNKKLPQLPAELPDTPAPQKKPAYMHPAHPKYNPGALAPDSPPTVGQENRSPRHTKNFSKPSPVELADTEIPKPATVPTNPVRSRTLKRAHERTNLRAELLDEPDPQQRNAVACLDAEQTNEEGPTELSADEPCPIPATEKAQGIPPRPREPSPKMRVSPKTRFTLDPSPKTNAALSPTVASSPKGTSEGTSEIKSAAMPKRCPSEISLNTPNIPPPPYTAWEDPESASPKKPESPKQIPSEEQSTDAVEGKETPPKDDKHQSVPLDKHFSPISDTESVASSRRSSKDSPSNSVRTSSIRSKRSSARSSVRSGARSSVHSSKHSSILSQSSRASTVRKSGYYPPSVRNSQIVNFQPTYSDPDASDEETDPAEWSDEKTDAEAVVRHGNVEQIRPQSEKVGSQSSQVASLTSTSRSSGYSSYRGGDLAARIARARNVVGKTMPTPAEVFGGKLPTPAEIYGVDMNVYAQAEAKEDEIEVEDVDEREEVVDVESVVREQTSLVIDVPASEASEKFFPGWRAAKVSQKKSDLFLTGYKTGNRTAGYEPEDSFFPAWGVRTISEKRSDTFLPATHRAQLDSSAFFPQWRVGAVPKKRSETFLPAADPPEPSVSTNPRWCVSRASEKSASRFVANRPDSGLSFSSTATIKEATAFTPKRTSHAQPARKNSSPRKAPKHPDPNAGHVYPGWAKFPSKETLLPVGEDSRSQVEMLDERDITDVELSGPDSSARTPTNLSPPSSISSWKGARRGRGGGQGRGSTGEFHKLDRMIDSIIP